MINTRECPVIMLWKEREDCLGYTIGYTIGCGSNNNKFAASFYESFLSSVILVAWQKECVYFNNSAIALNYALNFDRRV